MKIKYFSVILVLLIISLSIFLSGCNEPAPPTVNCNVSDLIYAIDKANLNPDHDQIILPDHCDFEFSKALYEVPENGSSYDLGYAGLPSITSPITITGNGSRLIRSSTPDTDMFRFFHVDAGGSLTLVDMKMENGFVEYLGGAVLVTEGTLTLNQSEFVNNNASEYGGAIGTHEMYNPDGDRTEIYIINSVFRSNTATCGGAIYQNAGLLDIDFETLFENNHALHCSGGAIITRGETLNIYNSIIRNNHAGVRGGGIFMMGGTVTLQGVLIENNTAESGGGLHSNYGNLIIRDSRIQNNQANTSGGLDLFVPNVIISDGTVIEGNNAAENSGGIGLVEDPTVSIENSMIINNQSGEEGGGIGPTGSPYHPTVTINNSTVSGNTAAFLGGGVYINSGEWQIHNSTISGNIAAEGGGIYNGGELDVTNSTISGNQAEEGGGVLHTADTITNFSFVTVADNTAISGGGLEVENSWIYIANSIVAGNSPQNCLGNIQPFNNNLDDDASCAFSFTDNPLLEPLGDYGGPTFTHAISAFSPAIEVADPCTIMNETTPLGFDQRGESRPDGAYCDLGAFEANIALMMAPPIPACIFEATKNSHCRESDFNQAPVVEILLQGETAALVALNPENTYGKFTLPSGERCWIALNLMISQDITEDCPVPEENPIQIPEEKIPEKKTCKPTMGEAACKQAGGTWVGGVTEAPHCSCP